MADETVTTDTAGVARTVEGQIAEPQVSRTRSESTSTTDQTAKTDQKTTETKTAPEVKDGETLLTDKGKEAPKEAAKQAPDKYSDFTVPDGFTLDPEVATRAGTLFKELGLSQDGAQKLIDLYTAETKEAFEAPFKAYQDMRKEWRDKVTGDPRLGHRLPEIKTAVTQMLDTHLGKPLADQFREAMDLTGVGDHPAFVHAFDVLSQLLTESRSHVGGNRPSTFGQNQRSEPVSAAQAIYPHLPSNAR